MPHIPYQDLKNTAFKAADAAKKITLKYFRADYSIHSKSNLSHDWDPVTQADKEAEAIIRKIIEQDFPNHGIIGEELPEKTTNSDYRWIIDPIDGTRSYIAGLPMWSTLIGLLYKDTPIFGLMSQPLVGDIFYGDTKTAFLVTRNGEKQLQTSQTNSLEKARIFCTTPDMFKDSPQILKKFSLLEKKCISVRYGTDAYGYTALAAGWGDIVFESDIKPYDILPIVPIIQGAGGFIRTLEDTSVKYKDFNSTIIATNNEKISHEILALITQK